jgi:hypothetical protein
MSIRAAPIAGSPRPGLWVRDEIEAALVFDRAASTSLQAADRELAAAAAALVVCVEQNWGRLDSRMAHRGVDVATEARAFAADYQARCRTTLTRLLDRVAVMATLAAEAGPLSASGGAGSSVRAVNGRVAPGIAVDAAADLHAATVVVASTAEDAVSTAAVVVACAADDARHARRIADAFAADGVAVMAARTAANVKRRADQRAAAISAAGSAAVTRARASTTVGSARHAAALASRVSAAASARAEETAAAAEVVAQAVAAAAAAVAAANVAQARIIRLDVVAAAAAVRRVADATARTVADATAAAEAALRDQPMA